MNDDIFRLLNDLQINDPTYELEKLKEIILRKVVSFIDKIVPRYRGGNEILPDEQLPDRNKLFKQFKACGQERTLLEQQAYINILKQIHEILDNGGEYKLVVHPIVCEEFQSLIHGMKLLPKKIHFSYCLCQKFFNKPGLSSNCKTTMTFCEACKVNL